MPKKIKPNKLFDDEPSPEEAIVTEMMENKANDVADTTIIGAGRLTEDDAEKLKKYDAMEKSLSDAAAKCEMLESKLAQYLEKDEEARNESSKIESLEKDKKSLEEQCKQLEDKCNTQASELLKLKNEMKSLKVDSDKYLVKISELTFENANLASQLSEITGKMKKSGNVSANQKKFSPSGNMQYPNGRLAAPNRDPYNPYANNGYGSW